MSTHSSRLVFYGDAQVTLYSHRLEPGSINGKDITDIARVRGDLTTIDELAGRALECILQAFLVATANPEGQHARPPPGQEPRCEGPVSIQSTRQFADNLLEKRFPGFAGNAFLDAAQQLECV